MSLRSWAIRGLILTGVAAVAALVWFASAWVSPDRVKQEVINALEGQLQGVDVTIGSAHMRIMGGIAVTDLRLTRKAFPGEEPFLTVPSAVIYHDKEQLNRGQLVIKKIELNRLDLKLERSTKGKWNVSEELFKKGPADKLVPTFLIQDAHVHIIDHGPEPLPELSLNLTQLTLVNDPIPVLAITAKASAKNLGPIKATARLDRIKNEFSVGLELAEFPLGETISGNADRFAPGLAHHLAGLAATASIKADLTYLDSAEPGKQWSHHIAVELKNARYTHPELPWPVENIAAVIHIVDGDVTVKDASARVGGAGVKLSVESRANRPASASQDSTDPLKQFEDHLAGMEVAVTGLKLDDVLYRALPEAAQHQWKKFSPTGVVDLNYKFSRGREKGNWQREFELIPKQITMIYQQFQYPLTEVGGRGVKLTMKNVGDPVTSIDLMGIGAGQLITISGQVTGTGDDPGINLRVVGRNVPIDDKLVRAMPEKYAGLVRRFHAIGRGDFIAEFVQQQGVNLCEEEFRIEIQDAKIRHEDFPYPLEQVKGRLFVRSFVNDAKRPIHPGRPDEGALEREEIVVNNVTAIHNGASITIESASKQPIPGTRDAKIIVHLGVVNCPVDSDLQAMCRAFKINSVWTTFRPQGKLSFTARLELIDRASQARGPELDKRIDPFNDLILRFQFRDATVSPTFFAYEMNDFAGKLDYRGGRVLLDELSARHGESRIKLDKCEARFYPDGVVWANLGGLEVKPLIADEAFLKALPPKLSSGLTEVNLKGRAELKARQLTVLTPPDSPGGSVVTARLDTTGSVLPASGEVQRTSQSSAEAITASKPASPAGRSPVSAASDPGTTLPPGQAVQSQPDPKVYWDLELKLTGASFDTGVQWDQAFGTVRCEGLYEGTRLGKVRGEFWLDNTSIAGQPLTRIQGKFGAEPQKPDPLRPGDYSPTVIGFSDLKGWLFHGTVGGLAEVMLASPVRFNLWLVAADVNLEEVAKHYNLGKAGSDADLKGIAQAKLWLYNRPDQTTGQFVVEGSGSIDVPTGRMYNLPILLDLVKLSKFESPNKTAFEEAHATFRILGDRVKVDRIDMIGRAVCLGGAGEMDTSGNYVNFDFYTIWSTFLAQLINSPVGELTEFLSKNIITIKLTRENGVLKYKPVLFKEVTEPASAVLDRLRLRFSQFFGVK